MTVPAAAATTPTSTVLSPAVSRFSETRLVPDTLAMAWRSLIIMVRNPGEFYDILIQPIMFTVLFGELFGGAIAGDVKAYLPTIVSGLVIINALTTSQSVGVDLREDINKGVFDRFRTMPMSRIAPVLGSMVADVLRYLICTSLTIATGAVMGYRPVNGWSGAAGAVALAGGCAWAIAWGFLFLGTLFSSFLYLDGKLMDALRSDHTSRYLPHETHPIAVDGRASCRERV